MLQSIKKLDEHHNERTFTMQSSEEAQSYRQTFPDSYSQNTHAVRVKWLDEMHFKTWPETLSLSEIAARSDGFKKLSLAELRWLAQEHKIDVKDAKNTSDAGAIVAALAKKLATDRDADSALTFGKLPLAKQEQTRLSAPEKLTPPSPQIVPADIKAMDDATLETKAGEMEVPKRYPNWSKMKRPAKEAALAKAIAAAV